MTYLWSGGLTARRCYTLRCNGFGGMAGLEAPLAHPRGPTEAFMGSAHSVFNLAALDERTPCHPGA
jgi:hypothetical protein